MVDWREWGRQVPKRCEETYEGDGHTKFDCVDSFMDT